MQTIAPTTGRRLDGRVGTGHAWQTKDGVIYARDKCHKREEKKAYQQVAGAHGSNRKRDICNENGTSCTGSVFREDLSTPAWPLILALYLYMALGKAGFTFIATFVVLQRL